MNTRNRIIIILRVIIIGAIFIALIVPFTVLVATTVINRTYESMSIEEKSNMIYEMSDSQFNLYESFLIDDYREEAENMMIIKKIVEESYEDAYEPEFYMSDELRKALGSGSEITDVEN